MRKQVSNKGSKKLFKRTALRTKKVNLQPITMRGGIRL